jgi:hypothetical protein
MAKDTRSVLQTVVRSALQSPAKGQKGSSGLSAGRAALLGAGIFAAGRLTAHGSGGLVGSVQHRLLGQAPDDESEHDDVEGYGDEEYEDYDEDEPEAEDDEDFEDEDEEEEDEEEEDEEPRRPTTRRRRRARSHA